MIQNKQDLCMFKIKLFMLWIFIQMFIYEIYNKHQQKL